MESFTLLGHAGANIRGYIYPPIGKARAVFQICHGMCEYIGRYEPFIAFLNSRGFLVIGHDHMGHGGSAATAEELGYFGENGAETLVLDTHAVSVYAGEHYPDLPLILMGHSMGSFVTRAYLERFGKELDGCIIMGTAGPNPGAAAGIAAARLIARTRGAHYRSSTLQRMAFGSYNRKIKAPKSPSAWLTKDEAIVSAYDKDPYCNFLFTAAGFETLFTLLQHVSRPAWAGTVPKELPILMVAGAQDPVGDYGKGVRTVYDRLRAAGVRDITLHLYPEGRHEILNEPEKQTVYEDIERWLEERF